MTSKETPSQAPMPRRRSRLSRVLRVGVVLAIVLVGLVLAIPTILSMDWARKRFESEASAALGTEVKIGGYSFGWFSGLEVHDVAIANPKGFEGDDQLFEMRSLRGDASLVSALRGRYSVEGQIEGLALRVIQREDGTTNLGELLGVRPGDGTAPPPSESGGSTDVPDGADLANMRLDLQLRDSFIEVVHETNGVLERLEHVEARIAKDWGTNVVRLQFACDLARPNGGTPGRLELVVDAQPDPHAPLEARLRAVDLDLARYRPIVATFLPADQITAFAGVVTANTQVSGRPDEALTVEGAVDIVEPHFAGPLFGGLDLGAPRWTLDPAMTIGMPANGNAMALDFSKLAADLGFLKVNGLPTTDSRAGVGFALDVAALAARGGVMPAELRDSGTRLDGEFRMPLAADLAGGDVGALVSALVLQATLTIDKLDVGGQELGGVSAKLGLDAGRLAVEATSGKYGGGPLNLSLVADATKLDSLPLRVSLDLDGAQIGEQAVTALQYVFPLAAGISSATGGEAPVGLDGRLGLHLELTGPGIPGAGQDTLAWLDGWAGKGRVGLTEGKLRPAAALSELLQLSGGKSELEFQSFSNEFRIANGFVETLGAKLDAKGRAFGLTGRTGLAGALDWTIDVKNLLADHKDGKKVMQYLGDDPIGAALKGTLDAPTLAMPPLDEILKQAVQRAVEKGAGDLLQKEAGGLLDSILGGDKKKGIGGALEGLIPGKKKDAPNQDGEIVPPIVPADPNAPSGGNSLLEQMLRNGGKLPEPGTTPPVPTPGAQPDPIGELLRRSLERQKRENQTPPKKKDG